MSNLEFSNWSNGFGVLNSPELQLSVNNKIFIKLAEEIGFSKNVKNIFDNWIDHILPSQISLQKIELDKYIVSFSKIRYEQPKIDTTAGKINLYPKTCRDCLRTYSLLVKATVTFHEKNNFHEAISGEISIGEIPLMLGTKYCYLHGMTSRQIIDVGEDPNDPLSYFIIKGTEKTITIQEKVRVSHFFSFIIDPKGTMETRFTCYTHAGSTIVSMRKGKIWNTLKVKLQHFKGHHVLVFILFDILGVPVEEAITMILKYSQPEQSYAILLTLQSSILKYRAKKEIPNVFYSDILRKRNAGQIVPDSEKTYKLNGLEDQKRKKSKKFIKEDWKFSAADAVEYVTKDIMKDLFPHIPTARGKCEQLALMTCRMCEILNGFQELDDRDIWLNKRFETAGRSMEQLFNGLFSKWLEAVKNNLIKNNSMSKILQSSIHSNFNIRVITDDFETAFGPKAWGVKGASSNYKENITDVLKRETLMSVYSQNTKINTPTNPRAKQHKIREINGTQLGFTCIGETPEGQNCGLVKNTTITGYMSIERPLDTFYNFLNEKKLYTNGEQLIDYFEEEYVPYELFVSEPTEHYSRVLMANGIIIGWVNHFIMKELLISGKRENILPFDSTVYYNTTTRILEYYCDGSRAMRPLYVVQNNQLVMDIHNYWDENVTEEYISHLYKCGAIELIDARQQDDIVCAMSIANLYEYNQSLEEAKLERIEYRKINGFLGEEDFELFTRLYKWLNNYSLDVVMFLYGYSHESSPQNSLVVDDYWNGDFYGEKTLFEMGGLFTKEISTIIALHFPTVTVAKFLQIFKLVSEMNGDTIQIKQHIIEEYLSGERLDELMNTEYTHCEIDPISMFGLPCALIPKADSNQGPRTSYQASMAKQALSTFHYNKCKRFDTSFKVLNNIQRPIFESFIAKSAGMNIFPSGQMVMCAFLVRKCNNEDAILAKKEFLDNENFTITKYSVHKTIAKRANKYREVIGYPQSLNPREVIKYHAIDTNGLPRIGSYIKQGDCIISKYRMISNSDSNSPNLFDIVSVYAGLGDEGTVDQILVTVNAEGNPYIKVKLRQVRIQKCGDKFASRYSQKGTIGGVYQACDLPRVKGGPNDGLIPDFILNPCSWPSRMTMGKPKEMLTSKGALYLNERVDATTFHALDLEKYKRALIDSWIDIGYDEKDVPDYVKNGDEIMIHPNGKQLEEPVFVAPCYYQSLRHHVDDKIQMRKTGGTQIITHQPMRGRANEGGLRVGEMERDGCISHGATGILMDRLMYASDVYTTVFCRKCGIIATCNPLADSPNYSKCRICHSTAQSNYGILTFPFIFKLIMHMLNALGINVVLNLEDLYSPSDRPEAKYLV